MPEDEKPYCEAYKTGQEEVSTETIDLSGLFETNITETGSFDLRGVQAKSLSRLLDSLPMPAFLVDETDSVAFVNECWDKTIGQLDEIKGRAFIHLFPQPAQAAEVQHLLRDTFKDRKSRTRKLVLNTRKKQIWGRMHLRSLRFGLRRYILVLYQDLTAEKEQLNLVEKHSEELRIAHENLERRVEERTAELNLANERLMNEIAEHKRTERALRDSEAECRSVFDAVDEAFLVKDVDTFQIVDVNKRMCEIFGWTRDEIRNLTLKNLSAGEPLHFHKDLDQWLRHAAEGTPQLFEWILKDKHGRSFWAEVSLRRAPIGGHDRLLAVVRDITQRKELEEELRHSQKMEAVGKLAGGVAHDFNNLLTAILGNANMLLQQLPTNSESWEKAGNIVQGAQRASELTQQLLAFGRKQVLNFEVLDVNSVIGNVEEMVKRLVGPSVELIFVPDPSIPRVRADSSQIEHVLMNLAANARDAMPEGGELIVETATVCLDDMSARMHLDLRPGKYVMVAVSDTGVGMSGETAARVFEPFFTTKEQGKGTGLGLAMVYGILRQHNGHVTLRSEPGIGTTFKLYLPAYMDGDEKAQEDTEVLEAYQGTETVLLVEDEDLVRDLTSEILQMLGYKVLEVSDPEDAIRFSEQHEGPIHLLLTDVVMPKMDGSRLSAVICLARPETKVLYVSGYTESAIVHHGVLRTGVHFLQKPFSAIAIARRVREVLNAK